MKKGQVYEAIVERVDFPGRGVLHVGEDTVIVKNCLPGQTIKFRVSKVRKGKAEGQLLEVLEKSPMEIGRSCSHFGVCGGCTYLSLPYEEQLRMKEEQVKRLLDTCLDGQGDWIWEGIKGSPVSYEYRNKMEFSFGDEVKDGPLALGMHRRGSFYDVVTVDDCCLVDADYRLILDEVLKYFSGKTAAGRRIRHYHRLSHEGYLRHLLVRKALHTGEILVALVTSSQDPWGRQAADEEHGHCIDGPGELEIDMTEQQLIDGFLSVLLALESGGRLEGRFAGILHIVNDSSADVVQSDRTDILYGQDFFYEELLGLRFKVSVFSFFQTNSSGAEVLYETVREYVGNLGSDCPDGRQDKIVFDLYSGTGTIAQLVAPVAGKVIGVEIVEEAVLAARKNAGENGLGNCEFIAGDVLKVLDSLEEKPDLIILDPPRDGIHPKALPKIAAYMKTKKIIYISCKPTSLVRDIVEFQKYGYQVSRVCCIDMFPNTANVETLALLSKKMVDKG